MTDTPISHYITICAECTSKEELATYVSMIGEDDWCVNYDKDSRMCKIYETRPEFCVVDPRKFKLMYKVEKEDFNVRCCRFCLFQKNSDHSGYEKKDFIFSLICLNNSNLFYSSNRTSVSSAALNRLLMFTARTAKRWYGSKMWSMAWRLKLPCKRAEHEHKHVL